MSSQILVGCWNDCSHVNSCGRVQSQSGAWSRRDHSGPSLVEGSTQIAQGGSNNFSQLNSCVIASP